MKQYTMHMLTLVRIFSLELKYMNNLHKILTKILVKIIIWKGRYNDFQ